MLSSKAIKDIVTEARPIIERQIDDAERVSAFRELVASQGGDWSALKALIKAQIQDERDDAGDGKRVKRILEKADFSTGYAELLGWSNMNEKNFSDHEEFDPETGELAEATGAPADGVETVGAVTNPAGLSVPVTTALAARDVDRSAAPTPPRPRPVMRPHCQNREVCGGVGFNHCYSCQKLIDQGVAA